MKLRCILLIAFLCSALFESSVLFARKYASIVMDGHSGAIYHQANADVITYPASLTKMMTLYLTFKALKAHQLHIKDSMKVSKHASIQAPSKLGLKPGSAITVQNAILALVVKSANDAAVVLAEKLGGGSEAVFANKMTQQAKLLGMKNTVFKNASGLPNSAQVTTARDMAILARALYRDFPEYYPYFKRQEFVYKGIKHHTHNHLLGKVDGVDGVKTGFINASGFNLAASMLRGKKRLFAVVMGGESWRSRDIHMEKLLEAVYAQVQKNGPQKMNTIDDLLVDVSYEPDLNEDSAKKANLKKAVLRKPPTKKSKKNSKKIADKKPLVKQPPQKTAKKKSQFKPVKYDYSSLDEMLADLNGK